MRKRLSSLLVVPSFTRLYNSEGGGAAGGTTTDGGDAGGKGAGAGGDTGAKGGDAGGKEGGDAGSKGDAVARADHERALADMHRYKREAEKLKQEKEEARSAKLKENNQWKELAEAKELEAKSAREEKERIQNSYLAEKKYSAVREKCAALGLRPEAVSDLEMLDLESVQIETTSTGRLNVLGAEKFAERLKATKPHWFADKSAPNVNTKGSRVIDSDGPVTPAAILAAEKEGRKSGDMSKYNELVKKYQTQRAAGMRR